MTPAKIPVTRNRPRAWFWLLLLAGIGVDQGTKTWAIETIRPLYSQVLISEFWSWTYVENTGVAFGFLQGHNNLLALLVIVLLLLGFRLAQDFNWKKTEVNLLGGLILAGAIGNGIDRMRYGYVIDFIDWHYRDWHWPAFNIADSLISLCVVWILFRQLNLKSSPPSSLLLNESDE